jgi:glycosyltransferase involved in cell wall biosynthesis
MKQTMVSVIIPTYNGEKYIVEALESINRQSLPVEEIIVVDDGSDDNTEKLVKQQRGNIRFIKQPHRGDPAYGRNLGVKEAKGDLIAFLDQDDLWPENKIEIQIDNLNRYPEAMVDVGITHVFNQKGERYVHDFGRFKEFEQYFLLSSGLFRKTVFQTVGLFDEKMKFHSSDYDWIFRAVEKRILFNLHKEVTLLYRHHNQNYSNDAVKLRLGLMEVVKRSLMRRRNKEDGSIRPLPPMNTTTKKQNDEK